MPEVVLGAEVEEVVVELGELRPVLGLANKEADKEAENKPTLITQLHLI
jgi:hypothetical protein